MPYSSVVSTFAHDVRYTYAEYLALEETSNVKHEYLGGQIYAMAGGTPVHAALGAGFVGLLFGQLMRGPGRAHSSDPRVRVRSTGLATYPDVTVVCGPRSVDPDDANAVTNPTLIAEILSDSTADYDRGEKFAHYRQLESLQHYVLVGQDPENPEVVVRTRQESGEWIERSYGQGQTVNLPAISASLSVEELYAAAKDG